MKYYLWGIFVFVLFANTSKAQNIDSAAQIEVNGYIDTYYGFDNNKPTNGNRPYAIASARHNDFALNLAMLDMKYISQRIRARFAPAFGTYMNSNYAAEQGSLRNIVEASAGVKLSAKKEIWLDAGVINSPIGYENAISKNQLLYSRSLSAEFSPYYLAGVKLSIPVTKTLKARVYVVNGWQQITDVNHKKSVILNLEYKPSQWTINASVYYGDERNLGSVNLRNRTFFDANATYIHKAFKTQFGASYGTQKSFRGNSDITSHWWQANVAARYSFTNKVSLSARAELFDDENEVVAMVVTPSSSFYCSSYTIGVNYNITSNALFRFETRAYFADEKIFYNPNRGIVESSVVGLVSLVINFGTSFTVKQPSNSTNGN